MKTLKQILNQNHLIAKEMYYPEIILRSVREWLLLNLIDITELVGAEIYDANLINEYITDKLLEEI